MKHILISIIESIYIIFMFCFFTTKYNFAHPLTYFSNEYFYHYIGKTETKRSMICKFGHDISWVIGLYFILRSILALHYKSNSAIINKLTLINKVILISMIIGSLVNMNAFIYLIPIFIIEYYLISIN